MKRKAFKHLGNYHTYNEIVSELKDISLDQMIDLMIKALSALKRVNELEAEVSVYRSEHEALIRKIAKLEMKENQIPIE